MDRAISPDPDEMLREAVVFVLSTHGLGPAEGLRVGVVNGVVHLAGAVETQLLRNTAEEIARCVKDVRGVVNRIEAPGAPSPTRVINLDLNQMQKKT